MPNSNNPFEPEPLKSPKKLRASRNVFFKSTGSVRSLIVGRIQTGAPPQAYSCESWGEANGLFIFLARPDVIDVWAQPTKIPYVNLNGDAKKYTFDFRLIFKNGFKLAVEYKAEAYATHESIVRKIDHIRPQLSPDFAHDAVILHENSFHQFELRNAKMIHNYRRFDEPAADAAVERVIANINGPVTLGEIADAAEIGSFGYRAAVRAVGDGKLKLVKLREFSKDVLVQKG